MHYPNPLISLTTLTLLSLTTALGINCRGSALCDRATLSSSDKIVQVFRDAVYASQKPLTTTYYTGDHILCISQSEAITITAGVDAEYEGVTGSFSLSGTADFQAGGICVFPQGASLTLGEIQPLADAVLEHGCSTCGSVPIHFVDQGSNDPSQGILTFNYVENPFCDGECISDTGASSKLKRSAKFGAADLH